MLARIRESAFYRLWAHTPQISHAFRQLNSPTCFFGKVRFVWSACTSISAKYILDAVKVSLRILKRSSVLLVQIHCAKRPEVHTKVE